jgi:protein LTV1
MGNKRFPKKGAVTFRLFYGGTTAPSANKALNEKVESRPIEVTEEEEEDIVDENGDVGDDDEDHFESDGEVDEEEKPQPAPSQKQSPPVTDAKKSSTSTTAASAQKKSKLDADDVEDEDEIDEEGEGEDEGEDGDFDGEEGDDDFEGEDEGEDGEEGEEKSKGSATRAQSSSAQKHSTKRKQDDREEYEELAFGPGDDYDYSQHVKVPGRGVWINADYEYMEKVLNTLDLGKQVKKLREMHGAQYIDSDEIQDKDIDAALFATEEHYDALDDDFVLQANGGILPSADAVNKEVARIGKQVRRMKLANKGKSKDDEFADFDDFDGFEYEDDELARPHRNRHLDMDDDEGEYDDDEGAGDYDFSQDPERKPRFIDEQFEHVLDQYDEANIGEYMDPRDPEVMGKAEADLDDPIFQEYVKLREKLKKPATTPSSFANLVELGEAEKENLKPIPVPEVDKAESSASEFEEDPLKDLYPPKKVEQWDCESFLSTYSNLENHPKLIVETNPNKNKIKLSTKTGLPLGVLNGRSATTAGRSGKEVVDDDDEEDDSEEETSENLGKPRSKTETPEERKERKKQLKESKKLNREKKKLVKQAYKSEEIRQTNVMVSQRVNQRVVYKF